MLHACRIKNGKVSYSNSFVQTDKLKFEKKNKGPFFLKVSLPLKSTSEEDVSI